MRNYVAHDSAQWNGFAQFVKRCSSGSLHWLLSRLSWRQPALLLTTLLVSSITVALMAFHISSMRDSAFQQATQTLEMVTRMVSAHIATQRRKFTDQAEALNAHDHVTHFIQGLPSSYAASIYVFQTDDNGQFKAHSTPVAIELSTFKPVLQAILQHFEKDPTASVVAVDLPDQRPAYAIVHKIPEFNTSLITLMSHADVYASWHNELILVGQLVVAFCFVLLGLLNALLVYKRDHALADQKCEQLKKRMDTALLRGQCGLWDWDIAQGLVYWSDSMYAVLGRQRTSDCLSFGELRAITHPDDDNLYELANHAAKGGSGFLEHDFRLLHAKGHWVWIRARAHLVRCATGLSQEDATLLSPHKGVHLVGIAIDVTAQKTFAQRTEASDQRLRDAIEATSEAFVLWDENRRLVLCNDRFKSMRNLREEDVKVGAHWHDVMAASALPVHENYLTPEDDVFDDGRTIEIELADGRWFKINERRTREGGYVSIGTDITALKQQELHLTASEHTLQQTVEAMTRTQSQMELQAQQLTELAEKYLEQKAHAESANHAKSRFLASMSHNLRTPLNAIIGFSDMMEHEIFGKLGCDKYVEYCHDIKISGQYLLSVIDDILDMSRIEAGRIILERQPLAVETMLETCLKSIQPLLEEKKISVSMRIAEMCDVNADKRALQKIMIHILENAAKYTPQNGEIKIRVRKTENAVNFAIEDNGRGIPRDVARRLGQPFEQGCAHPHHAAQGSGLGVAIARSLTEMHGGVLRIKSTEGVGTIVLIHIPHALSANQLINPRLEDQDDLSIDDIQLSLPIGDVVEFRKVDHVNQPLSQTKIAPTLDSDVITSFERSAHGESNSQHNIHVLQQPDTVSPLSVRKVQARNTSASHRQSIKWLKSSA